MLESSLDCLSILYRRDSPSAGMAMSTTARTAHALRTIRSIGSCSICNSPALLQNLALQVRNYATPVSSTRSPSSSSSSSSSSGSSIPNPSAYAVFDRSTKIKQKNRAVRRNTEHSRLTDYVKDEIAANLVERLLVSS